MSFVATVLACSLATVDLDTAIAGARSGRFAEALLAAEAEPDASRRAEARIYVRHHAGDLSGALRAAAIACEERTATAWVEEREAFVALSVRDTRRARRALDALDARPDRGGADLERAANGYRAELEDLERVLAARDVGIARARTCVVAGLALMLALVAWFSFTRDRGRPSP